MRLFLFLLLLSPLISSDLSPLTFNDDLRDRIQKFHPSNYTSSLVKRHHLLSMLARYSRIHKHFVQTLDDGRTPGYRYRFPDPVPDFDQGVAKACSQGNATEDVMMNCLHYMASKVIPRTNWANRSIDLYDKKLIEEITDSAFAEVLTFVGIMCWGTLNRLSLFEDISCADVFYTKIASHVGKFKWDGPLNSFDAVGGPLHGITTLHEDPFHCAELSFCPNPCITCVKDNCNKLHGCLFERHLNIDLLGMIENRWNLTFPCGNNQIYRPDLDVCVHNDDCMYKNCPSNSVCEEGLPTSRCICMLGYAPDDNGNCAPIDLSSIHIPWTSPYETDDTSTTGWTIGVMLLIILR